MKARILIAPAVFLLAFAALIALMLSGRLTSQAVQNPTMAIDMVTTGNTYDDTTNTMNVASTENCSTSAINTQHQHAVHIVTRNVEDLIGWQARVNYLGDKMRPNTVSFVPFLDNSTAQNISFNNLPIDQAALVHRDLVTASSIPAAAAGPQTAAFGSSYIGVQDFAISPDTPAKAVPDDSSYSAPSGGVLATILLQVIGDQTGNQLFMNLDDGSPNSPGTGIAYFNGTSSQTIDLPSSALGDGFHGEGVTCAPQDCTTVECPPLSPTPTPATPTPTQTPVPYFLRELDSPNPTARSFGYALAMLDSNNDGAADIAVGAPGTNIGGNVNRGQAYLISGSDGASLHTFDSANPLPQGDPSSFGIAAAMGDATGDGRADVLIGAQQEDGPNSNNAQGRAYLFDGATGGLLFAFDTPDPGFCCANFGRAVAMGDVSGDARADVAAAGGDRVYVFSGATGSLVLSLSAPGAMSLAIGDIDRDQRGDIVAGGNEQVLIFSGATGALIRTLGSPVPQGGEEFGNAVALGEANGDGIPDVAVGAPFYIDNQPPGSGTSSGIAFLFSGADGRHLATFHSPNPQGVQRFGDTLAAGDTGGDGRAEILIGAPREDVGPNVDQGRVYLFNSATGALSLTLNSPNPQVNGHFGQGLAMGNVTGDARFEAAVGARDEDVGASTDRGRVYLFEFPAAPTTPTPTSTGGTPTPTCTCTVTPSPTPTATCTCSATPPPTPTAAPPGTLVTFSNDTGTTADDLHFFVGQPGMTLTVDVETNASGCAAPSAGASRTSGPDFTFVVNVVWPAPCVDSGESVTLRLTCSNPGPPGSCTPLVLNDCADWTLAGSIIGSPCPTPPSGSPTPTPPGGTLTPTPTPTPTFTSSPASHDSRPTRISGVSRNVRLSPGGIVADNTNIVVANQSGHTDTIGVYVDVTAPAAGGCTPNGRVLQTTVTLAAGAKTTIPVPVSYSCADPAAANDLSFTWMAVADHGADDLASCGPGTLQGVACFDALADDDQDPADNRLSRNGPRVVAQ